MTTIPGIYTFPSTSSLSSALTLSLKKKKKKDQTKPNRTAQVNAARFKQKKKKVKVIQSNDASFPSRDHGHKPGAFFPVPSRAVRFEGGKRPFSESTCSEVVE